MTRLRPWIAFIFLLLPIAARIVWFYNGWYTRTAPVATPDYASLKAPVPPLSTPEPAAEKSGGAIAEKVIAVDLAHKNQFGVPEMEALTQVLAGRGAQIRVLQNTPSLAEALKFASAYGVIAPSAPFTSDEVQLVQRFVEQGGRVVVIADPSRPDLFGDSVTAPNSLLVPFDLMFSDGYLYNLTENEGNYSNVILNQFTDDPLTAKLTKVVFYAAHPVSTKTGTPLIRADTHTLSSRTDTGGDLAAAALSANGQVLALGDLTFLTAPYYQVADNSRLIGNLADFLLSGKRTHDLADMPFIFTRPVSIVPTQNITLTADLLKSTGKLQAALSTAHITASVATSPTENSDLIVLASYSPGNDLLLYLQPFVPNIRETVVQTDGKKIKSADVPIPGVGSVARYGTGVMVFSKTDERTTLILLADNPDRLGRLVEVLASGDVQNCAIRESIALCNLLKPDESRTPPSASGPQPGEGVTIP
jgi:hypothetical protein